jgi:hypothetical protein
VRVQNLNKISPRSEFQANGKEDKDKGKGKSETFLEFTMGAPHFYSEQEDRPHQSYPTVDQVMDMCTGLMFAVKRRVYLRNRKRKLHWKIPKVGNPPWTKHGGIITADGS